MKNEGSLTQLDVPFVCEKYVCALEEKKNKQSIRLTWTRTGIQSILNTTVLVKQSICIRIHLKVALCVLWIFVGRLFHTPPFYHVTLSSPADCVADEPLD